MKPIFTLFSMTLLAGWLAAPDSVRADQNPGKDDKKPVPMDARALLEKGRESGPLPEDRVIRLGACLGDIAVKAAEEGEPANGHEFVCGDYVQNKIMVIGRDGQVKWEYPAPQVCDLWVLDNGNFLFTVGHGVLEVNRVKKVIFKYETTSEVFSCQRLPGGNTLVAETTAGRLVIVDPAGKVVKEVPLLQPGEKGGHGYVANVRQLANGHFMAAIYQGQLVREYDDDGKVVMQVPAPSGGRVAVRLSNGHTLIGTADCTEDPRFFEIDAAGKVTWELSNADLPGKELRHVCGIHRLPNGNTLLCNYLGHGQFGKAPHLIEITPDKKVVWTYGNHDDVRTVTCVQMLDDAGEKALR